jgi:hypothetical protein
MTTYMGGGKDKLSTTMGKQPPVPRAFDADLERQKDRKPADIVDSPQNGCRSAATGERESGLGKDQGW